MEELTEEDRLRTLGEYCERQRWSLEQIGRNEGLRAGEQPPAELCWPPHRYYLHTLVFRADLRKLEAAREAGKFSSEEVNEVDHRGNTPLILALKLCRLAQEYRRIVVLLLEMGADPNLKDSTGWSPLDISIATGDQPISTLLFSHLHLSKLSRLSSHWSHTHQSLNSLPDFYLEIRWEFDSSFIPLIKKFGPHDICHLWKVGSDLRLDTTLVSWRKLSCKRRQMSLIFRDSAAEDDPLPGRHLVLVNHSKEILIDLLEQFDAYEAKAVISDLMSRDPVQGDMTIAQCDVRPCRNWLGGQSTFKAGEFVGKKFEMTLQTQVECAKRGHVTPPIREIEYFENVRGSGVLGPSFEHRPLNLCADREDRFTHLARRVKANVWMSDNFPISLREFMPVLDVLGTGNAFFAKIKQFVGGDLVNNLAGSGFPVKLDLPLTMSIRAIVSFPKFELSPRAEGLFRLPDYKVESRRVGQKTMSSPKKRMMLIGMLI